MTDHFKNKQQKERFMNSKKSMPKSLFANETSHDFSDTEVGETIGKLILMIGNIWPQNYRARIVAAALAFWDVETDCPKCHYKHKITVRLH